MGVGSGNGVREREGREWWPEEGTYAGPRRRGRVCLRSRGRPWREHRQARGRDGVWSRSIGPNRPAELVPRATEAMEGL